MSEEVVTTHRNDRIARGDGGDKPRRRAIGRTVMSHLEHLGAKIDAFLKKSLLRFAAGIASEEHAKRAVLQDERDGVAVDRVAAFDERKRRPDKSQSYAVVGAPLHSGAGIDDRHAFARSRRNGIAIGMAGVPLTAVVELRDAQAPEHGCDAAGVIAVRMRQDQGVDLMDSVTEQKRHDDTLAHALGDGVVARHAAAFESPAGVHHQRVTSWRLNYDCIGLPNVEHRNAQPPVNGTRRPQHV